ncbi:unnamed protein product, partial [Onchocerca flexuosa]|uniref:DUF429 domain-containing protein n=1 Tax=Onchocerca flexuosa TaxID=387005 RepID=A0A183HMF4_9BILA
MIAFASLRLLDIGRERFATDTDVREPVADVVPLLLMN